MVEDRPLGRLSPTCPGRRGRRMTEHLAHSAWPARPADLRKVAQARGASTTYVRDRARGPVPRDNRRCSSAPGSGRTAVPRHNSQAGRKKEQKKFCCVTTRSGPGPAAPPEAASGVPVPGAAEAVPRAAEAVPRAPEEGSHESLWQAPELAAPAPPRHVLGELPAADAAVAGVWQPASDARVFGTGDLGSTVGSTAEPDRRGHSRSAGRSASPGVGGWSNGGDRGYTGDVPREGLLPEGPPERSAKSLGHFFWSSSYRGRNGGCRQFS
jgi:hypothetical protein